MTSEVSYCLLVPGSSLQNDFRGVSVERHKEQEAPASKTPGVPGAYMEAKKGDKKQALTE
jgi:hypothetical protein